MNIPSSYFPTESKRLAQCFAAEQFLSFPEGMSNEKAHNVFMTYKRPKAAGVEPKDFFQYAESDHVVDIVQSAVSFLDAQILRLLSTVEDRLTRLASNGDGDSAIYILFDYYAGQLASEFTGDHFLQHENSMSAQDAFNAVSIAIANEDTKNLHKRGIFIRDDYDDYSWDDVFDEMKEMFENVHDTIVGYGENFIRGTKVLLDGDAKISNLNDFASLGFLTTVVVSIDKKTLRLDSERGAWVDTNDSSSHFKCNPNNNYLPDIIGKKEIQYGDIRYHVLDLGNDAFSAPSSQDDGFYP